MKKLLSCILVMLFVIGCASTMKSAFPEMDEYYKATVSTEVPGLYEMANKISEYAIKNHTALTKIKDTNDDLYIWQKEIDGWIYLAMTTGKGIVVQKMFPNGSMGESYYIYLNKSEPPKAYKIYFGSYARTFLEPSELNDMILIFINSWWKTIEQEKKNED